MENMNTSSAVSAKITAARQPSSMASRVARSLVMQQLTRLQQGTLVIREAGASDVTVGDGNSAYPVAELVIHNHSTWRDLLTGGSIGAAEAYVAGDWNSPNLVYLLRFFSRNIDLMNRFEDRFSWVTKPTLKGLHWLNRNTPEGSRKNISAHYDLGNDLFELFLDPSLMYSSAIYQAPESTLDEASAYKLNVICRKLELKPSDQVLEIGTGWGGFAIHAAKHYGCHVTTTTISAEQLALAKQRVEAEGLQDRITLLFDDYRDLSGQYDKLVSIEMIEAVGPQFLPSYFGQISQLLKPEGLALIQAINMPEQRYQRALKNVDFIQRYIFPGSFIPSFGAMVGAVREQTDLVLAHVEDLGFHYARTLNDWCQRFQAHSQNLHQRGYDDAFQRLWHFYFAYCEAGFSERAIGVAQIVMAKPGHKHAPIHSV
ncbi:MULTISPECIES: cyclopropane-fatty-acyl-phospholipid synthase family protein [unclassified Marinobacter]|uniref:SAM-dependent methyltransferase n=1 Tax=unclassified Marinobacter TaxID=83889 RepID=UPI00200CF2EA|nr:MULTISPECIES: cyclopropane-fatty-acyl-phospholipid synthase family protein [unclassified Marinobacter]MCL1488737.1 cyclopropane-fatty-acyl-phospholipid synthase family protein [Marinobacter sp.]UQG54067.1 cyclopropane-fatty-acyl-phospholipid synthase family protein [Marinobacter sp. M4C]UQG62874.1 cyclopropane-fatty-acyl-phospholipid synthase family protein [Marinobacter sp. M2C]UQG67151.1 cyclopropane-fatty-acyl-phospholipid synthase family protein [Marinobacter sp. M1C]